MHIVATITALGSALLICAGSAWAGTLPTIDDFTKAEFYRPTPDGITTKRFNAANIAGGSRTITTYINANPFSQYSAVAVGRGVKNVNVGPGLFFSTGYGIAQRADLGYGEGKAMDLNVSQYGRFRVHFSDASIITLADLQVFTGTSYVQWGCNDITTNGSDVTGDVTVDYPFAYGQGVDYKNVNYIYLILQSNANLSVNKIEVVPDSAPQADFTCNAD
jgi:hypothetical protein